MFHSKMISNIKENGETVDFFPNDLSDQGYFIHLNETAFSI